MVFSTIRKAALILTLSFIFAGCGGGSGSSSSNSTQDNSGTAITASNTAKLNWNANTESDLAGYKIYYGTSPGAYSASQDVGNITKYTLSGLQSGKTYYFAVTAYNTSGEESTYSTEVSKTFP